MGAVEPKMKLEQVQVVFRHGARTPGSSWTKERFEDFTNLVPLEWDKNKLCTDLPGTDLNYTLKLPDGKCPSGPLHDEHIGTEMRGGCITSHLTNIGQKQLYDLGKLLSERYITNEGLISPAYQQNEIYVRSSYYQRTIRSVVCLLAGLYNDDETTMITGTVCIETKDEEDEDMLPHKLNCTNLIEWDKYIRSSASRNPEALHVENYINGLLGKVEDKENINFSRVNDLIRCRRTHGLSIPQFLLDNEEDINKWELKATEKSFGKGNLSIMRSRIGLFLETLCTRISECLEGRNTHKMLFYSAHDTTLFSMLLAFHVDIECWPPFASHLIIELYKREDGESFVRVVYNGGALMLDDSDSGDEFIPAERFLMRVRRVVDFDEDSGNIVTKSDN